jgi:DNA-binding CsgD family transcriptional regulator
MTEVRGTVDETIIGRANELRVVEHFLDDVSTGPVALVIEGEAGIGKTTVWLAAVRAAKSRSFRVLEARPAESEAKLSYAALADLLGGAFDETRGALPQVQERALAAVLLRAESDEPATVRITATALVGVLEAIARGGPVILAIDDVQWLDVASEQVLEFAVRRLPKGVGLMVTRRDNGGLGPPLGLGRALPEDRFIRIVPGPFSLGALHHLIVSRLGSPLARPLLVRLAAASGGNPFFALEIARALTVDDADRAVGPLPVPPSLEQLVEDRFSRLSDPAREAALTTAALSRPTAAEVTNALSDEADPYAALLEAEEAGVLVTERDRIRFAHPLLASVAYASASRERRRRLHERLAAVVADPEERARHLAANATGPDETVAAALERAAEQAARRGAHRAAAELFAASRRLTPERGEDLKRRSLGEAAALLAAGDIDDAGLLASEGATASASSLRARAHYVLGEIAWVSGSGAPSEHFAAALTAAPDDRALAARVYPKLISYTTPHDPVRAVSHAQTAMRLLDSSDQPGALASIVFDAFWGGVMSGRSPDWPLFERWQELETAAGPDAPKSPVPLIYYWSVDDVEGARARYAIEERWFRERGEDLRRAERLGVLAAAETRAGCWDVAEGYFDEACETLAHVQNVGPWALPFRQRSMLDAHVGRTERARKTVMPFNEEAERTKRHFWEIGGLSVMAFVEFAEGDLVAVDRALTRMRERQEAIGLLEFPPDRSEPFHIEALVTLGEFDRAHDMLTRLEHRGRVFPRLWITATLPRARALILAAEGDVGGALAALDELDSDLAAKLPFDLAWTLLVRGRLQRRAKQKRAAADTLRQALEIFERLDAPIWEAQTRAELDRVGLRRSPDELTATERRVAELAAEGLTNREVASKAFMSPKTVQANLTRIYRKLGIRSRAELGARMAEERRQLRAQK